MIIIGIETSCDETGIGLIKDKTVLANIVASQEDIHSIYGGVVPELASRAHLQRIDNLFKIVIERSKIRIEDIDLIGVTNHPGLKGSLLVGVSFASGVSYRIKKPIYFINHLHAHLAVNFLNEDIEFPALGLVISGGHTSFFYIENYVSFKEIGRTLDDACGETFDKIGRFLGLPFPAGPYIEKQAEKGDERSIKFPIPMLYSNSLDFSFSGLKTAIINYVKKYGKENIPDICASFQKTVGDLISRKIKIALKQYNVKSILLGGGVVVNKYLQKRIKEVIPDNMKLYIPEKNLCLDNGVMVAAMTYFLHKLTPYRTGFGET
ncbi:MAG: tRNA (adenosine(37)-N6)-threonylcarbamoyltransferase complex transferase subunit TsaD [Candidatus Omnitrophica bacterium]|nr:tRNA (adenosine(37)-N6)-threonylcarbamoyltransferase complex transferase subunit TsaD [Candidatus Omnitrophota bacterium]MCM8802773.1 tRNA (adenosine(37)-N6)-threonylcarbamoyltransferase complex transferase subunit TsaD [Candidatus Omnitrophota bacterium]